MKRNFSFVSRYSFALFSGIISFSIEFSEQILLPRQLFNKRNGYSAKLSDNGRKIGMD